MPRSLSMKTKKKKLSDEDFKTAVSQRLQIVLESAISQFETESFILSTPIIGDRVLI